MTFSHAETIYEPPLQNTEKQKPYADITYRIVMRKESQKCPKVVSEYVGILRMK